MAPKHQEWCEAESTLSLCFVYARIQQITIEHLPQAEVILGAGGTVVNVKKGESPALVECTFMGKR